MNCIDPLLDAAGTDIEVDVADERHPHAHRSNGGEHFGHVRVEGAARLVPLDPVEGFCELLVETCSLEHLHRDRVVELRRGVDVTFGFYELGSFCGRAQAIRDLLDLVALDRPTDGSQAHARPATWVEG